MVGASATNGLDPRAKGPSVRTESHQKLAKFTPRSLGQALRISGITPADVTLLAVHLANGGRTPK
jgi:tRNA U34 5-carboxymethylaminomethyl modifying enzyme MnmG/GidA